MQAAKTELENPWIGRTIGRFTLAKKIGEGATSVVYSAVYDGGNCAFKIMRADVADRHAAAMRFRREAEILGRMNHRALVKIIELGEADELPYVAMELLEGEELSVFTARGALSETQILQVAADLAGALGEVHRHGFVHRDIKPQNIFIGQDGGARLIDFGFAEGNADLKLINNEAVGTFLYASPEQAGTLKAEVDATSDLYSVGAVLFECATGHPPFRSDEIGELLRLHLEQRPELTSQINSGIRPALALIIAKLLEKKPADRYQTAEGLLFDLKGFANLDAQFKEAGTVSLGNRDFRIGRQNEMPLLGRTSEMEMLAKEVAAMKAGGGCGFLVEGEPGSGKSYLIKKFLETVDTGILKLSGKCQLTEQTPLGPLREMVEAHIRDLRAGGEARRDDGFAKLRAAAKDAEVFVGRISRSLSEILGNEKTGESKDSENQDMFFSAISEFIFKFARAHGRIVMHVDDVQWLDQASLGILTRVQEQLAQAPIIFLTTGRNDGGSIEALNKVAALWAEGGVRRLNLRPLTSEAIAEIVSAQLGGAKLEAAVVERLATKANGNPFAISQYVYSMLDGGIISRQQGEWIVDGARLDELIISSDVIQLILARMNKLGKDCLQVLRVAAVVGNKFDLSLVAAVLGTGKPEALAALNEAGSANLIEAIAGEQYAFVHDRVLEALIQSQSAHEVVDLHQRVAEVMDSATSFDLYALASHYGQGNNSAKPLRVFETNLEAGIQSLENFANEDATAYLEKASEVWKKFFPDGEPEKVLGLYESLGIAYWRRGMGPKAIENCQNVLLQQPAPLVRARVHAIMTNSYFNENQGAKGWNESELGLMALGITFPGNRIGAKILNLIHWIRYFVVARLGTGFGSSTGDDLNYRRIALSLYAPSCFASFVGLRWNITTQLVPRMLYHLHKTGDRLESASGLAYYAQFLGFNNFGNACLKVGRRALKIAENSGDNQAVAQVRFLFGFGIHWGGMPKEAEKFQKESLLSYGRWMAPRWFISTANDLAGNNLLIRGYARDALSIAELCRKKADATRNVSPIAVANAMCLGVHAVLGQETEVLSALEKLEKIYAGIPEGHLDWCWYLAHRILVYNERNEPVPELDVLINRYLKMKIDPASAPLFFKAMYLHMTYASLNHYLLCAPETRHSDRTRLNLCLANLKRAASVAHWECHYWIIRASASIFEGHPGRATKYLRKAEKLAESSDSPWGIYQIHLSRARIAKARADLESAIKFAMSAEAIAAENGWTRREAAVRKEFQADFAKRKMRQTTVATKQDGVHSETLQRQFDALLSISRVSAQAQDLNELMDNTLNELIKMFAADRAYFFMPDKSTGVLMPALGRDAAGLKLADSKGFSMTAIDKVRTEKKTIILTGTAQGVLLGSQSMVAQDLRSIIAAPLMFRQKFLGVIYLDSRMVTGLFDQEDVKLLEGISSPIAIFIESAQKNNRLRALLELSLASGAIIDPAAQARAAIDEIIEIMSAQRGFLFLAGEADSTTTLKMTMGRDNSRQDLSHTNDYSTTIVEKVRKEREPILVTGTAEGELLGSRSAVVHNLRSIMAAPLRANDKFLGVLYLDSQVASGGFTPDDVKILSGIAGLIAIAFSTARAARVEVEKRALMKDLELTGAVQGLLLPRTKNWSSGELNIVGYYKPTLHCGGDWWWHGPLANGNVLVVVGDVTGHGPASAMVTAIVAGICRTVIAGLPAGELNALEMLAQINARFLEICEGNYWMTMALVEIDPGKRLVKFWSVAAPPLLVLAEGKDPEMIQAKGAPLGMDEILAEFESRELAPGETLFIPTDGVVEMVLPNGRQLGNRGMNKLLAASGDRNLNTMSDKFIEALDRQRGAQPLADDITFVMIRFEKESAS